MNIKINERVSVNLIYDHLKGITIPKHIKWHNRTHTITEVGLHYRVYRGKVLTHLFAVSTQNQYFLLSLNTQTLVWYLEEVGDNETSL